MSSVETKPGIVLFNPSPWGTMHYCGLPLALLAISALPHERGYPVTIVVQDIDEEYERKVLEACEGALLFGVTSLTGHMIDQGLEMSAKVRERYPELPIVWGGTHPSIAPEQTCEHPLVDVVVAGQGEATFMELVEAIEAGRPLDEVDGLYFKRDGRIVKTGVRATVDIDTLPPLPFDLLDVDRFVALHSTAMSGRLDGRRAATYYSSYGCPFSCSFCSEPMTSNRRWYSKSPERVIEELETLKRDYGVEAVIFEDPIYFVDVRRVKRIAELMIERGLDIVWSATSRLETIKKIDQPTWDLLKKAGFIQVFIGIESASPTVLKAIGKKYTVDDILDVARIFDEQEITFTGSFIQGIPVKTTDRTLEEITREDMRLASDTVLKIYEANPKAVIYVVLYTPYPGSVAYHLSIENGFVPPDSLEGWCDFNHQVKSVPWTLKEQEYFCATWTVAQKVIRGGRDRARFRRNKLKGSLLFAYGAITRARYRHGYFKYPVEQHLMAKLARRVALARNPDAQANNGMLI